MPRHARIVFPGVAHHVTQRGNNRRQVFFEQSDGFSYLRLLRECTQRYAIELVAYCLMPNHVHLVVIPSSLDGLHRACKVIHGRYARRINQMRSRVGHLWQDRFFSSALDENHFVNAVRYVELNPVRAGLIDTAESYEWSSAATHCGLRSDTLVTHRPASGLFQRIDDWSAWLRNQPDQACVDRLRLHINQNLPCGSEEFVEQLGNIAARPLRFRQRGRPRRPSPDGDSSKPFLETVSVPSRKRGRSPTGKG